MPQVAHVVQTVVRIACESRVLRTVTEEWECWHRPPTIATRAERRWPAFDRGVRRPDVRHRIAAGVAGRGGLLFGDLARTGGEHEHGAPWRTRRWTHHNLPVTATPSWWSPAAGAIAMSPGAPRTHITAAAASVTPPVIYKKFAREAKVLA